MTSYEELAPEQREQVDTTVYMIEAGIVSGDMADTERRWLREALSKLVLTCVDIERKQIVHRFQQRGVQRRRHGNHQY